MFAGHDPVVLARRAVARVIEDVGDVRVEAEAGFSAVARALYAADGRTGTLGVALDVVPAAHIRRLQDLLPGWGLVDVSKLVLAQRSIKDPSEIDALTRAAELASVVDDTIRAVLRPGIEPVRLMAEVGRRLRWEGAEEILFFRRWDAWLPMSGVCASGPEAAIISGHAMTVTGLGLSRALPWGSSRRPIERGEPVYVDLGLNLAGYHADVTRTYVIGSASDQMQTLFDASLAAQQAALGALTPGVPARLAMLAARQAVASRDLGAYFQGHGSSRATTSGTAWASSWTSRPSSPARSRRPWSRGCAWRWRPRSSSRVLGQWASRTPS